MSASLVGSEMCIRDSRTPSCPSCRSPVVGKGEDGRRKGCRGVRKVPSRSCLLYTSDAADDM
eukprot:6281005-Alexandrium_andersonii.AAC.1